MSSLRRKLRKHKGRQPLDNPPKHVTAKTLTIDHDAYRAWQCSACRSTHTAYVADHDGNQYCGYVECFRCGWREGV